MLYLETTEGFVPWRGEPIGETQYPRDIEGLMTEEQLEELGLFVPQDAEPAPKGQYIVSQTVQRVDGVVRYVGGHEQLPDPEPEIFEPISLKQFSVVLTQDGVITQNEALLWAAERVLPVALSNVVETVRAFDPNQAFLVEMDLRTSTQFERYHPNTPMIAYMLSTPERQFDSAALDDIWTRGVLI